MVTEVTFKLPDMSTTEVGEEYEAAAADAADLDLPVIRLQQELVERRVNGVIRRRGQHFNLIWPVDQGEGTRQDRRPQHG